METRVRKWGNSLALRIPKSLATQVGLEANTTGQIVAARRGVSHCASDATPL